MQESELLDSDSNGIKQTDIGVVDELLVGLGVSAHLFLGHIGSFGVVGGDHGALAFELGLLEQLEVTAGFVDAGGHQDGITALADQARLFHGKVVKDISHDPIHPRFGTQQGLHGAPLAF